MIPTGMIRIQLVFVFPCKMPKIKKYQNCKNDVYQPDEKGYPQTVFSHSICYRVDRKTVVDNTSEKL